MIQAGYDVFYWLGSLVVILCYLYYLLSKKMPTMTTVIVLIASVFAVYSAGELVYNMLQNETLDMGDLNNARLVVTLGGIAIIWIAMATVVNVIRSAVPR